MEWITRKQVTVRARATYLPAYVRARARASTLFHVSSELPSARPERVQWGRITRMVKVLGS